MFSSGKHRHVSADPYPFEDSQNHRYSPPEGGAAIAESGWNAGHWVEVGGPLTYSPRPEFNQPLKNPTNPFLAAWRNTALNARTFETFLYENHDWLTHNIVSGAYEHALKVASRMVDLEEKASGEWD